MFAGDPGRAEDVHPILVDVPLPGGDAFALHSYGVFLALAVVFVVGSGVWWVASARSADRPDGR